MEGGWCDLREKSRVLSKILRRAAAKAMMRSYCLARFVRFSCNEIDDAAPRQWTSGCASGYRALEFLAVATVKTFKGQQGRTSRNQQVPLRRTAILCEANVCERQPERDASDE